MAEKQPSPRTSSSSSLPTAKFSIVDELLKLTASSELDTMLGKALRMAIKMLKAEAGSILFNTHPPKSVQSGAFRPEAMAYIQRWEQTIGRRFKENSWHMPTPEISTVPVTISSGSQLTLVSVPLLHDTRVMGLLSLVLSPDVSIANAQRQMLEKIARGIGQTAWLINELTLANLRLERVSQFFDVGQALVTTFDIGKLLTDTMELATKLLDAGAASIMLIDENKSELVFKVSHGTRTEMLRQHRISIDEGIAGWVASYGRPVIANDARNDSRFSHRVDVRTGFLTQSIAAVPLKTKGRVIGVLEVLNKYSETGFDQNDIQLMSFIASQAAIALENARAYNKLLDERNQFVTSQENTQRELTRNLHDGTLQYLSAISLSLEHINILSTQGNPEVLQHQITTLQNLAKQAVRNTRSLLFELRPPILETKGLVPACEYYLDQLQNVSDISLKFESIEQINFGAKINGGIFSIIKEAINNTIRHANANNLWLTLEKQENNFTATIRDDGRGFDLDAVENSEDKNIPLGILQMREQATAIEAELHIKSRSESPRRGTTIRLVLPLPDEA